MIAALMGLLVPLGVVVDAPPACTDAKAVEDAVPLDVAEDVVMRVVPAEPDAAGREQYRVSLSLRLLQAAPSDRTFTIRPFECRDLPDLVALLVTEERERARQRARTMSGDAGRRRRFGARQLDRRGDHAARPQPGLGLCEMCDAPPDLGGFSLATTLGPYGALRLPPRTSEFGARLALDMWIPLWPEQGLVVGAETLGTTGGHAYLFLRGGTGWYLGRGDVVVSWRASLGVGGAVISGEGYDAAASPEVSFRARQAWLFLEAGAFLLLTTHQLPAPGAYVALGVFF